MTTPTTCLPDRFRPAPIAVEVIARYRGKCTRCGRWWRPASLVAKTTAGQYICWNCIRTIETWLEPVNADAGHKDDTPAYP